MKVTENIRFNLKNFNKDNTPKKLANVVNKLMILGTVIGTIGLTIAAPPIGIATGIQIAAYSGTGVAILKTISKLFGEEIEVKEAIE